MVYVIYHRSAPQIGNISYLAPTCPKCRTSTLYVTPGELHVSRIHKWTIFNSANV